MSDPSATSDPLPLDRGGSGHVLNETRPVVPPSPLEAAETRIAELEAQVRDAQAAGQAFERENVKLRARVDELTAAGAVAKDATFVAGRDMDIVGADGVSTVSVKTGDPIPHAHTIPHLETWLESGHILVKEAVEVIVDGVKSRAKGKGLMAPASGDPRAPRSTVASEGGSPVEDAAKTDDTPKAETPPVTEPVVAPASAPTPSTSTATNPPAPPRG